MKVSVAKLGVLAAVATVLVLFAMSRLGTDTPVAEADLASPGGIAALPSAAPGLPGAANQGFPAIIHARGDGSNALVTVFCDDDGDAVLELCDGDDDGVADPVTFEMTQASGDGSLASSFDATGGDTVVCRDNTACDLDDVDGIVTVLAHGGGENEMVDVTATDDVGEVRSVQIVVVDTILAWGSTGAVSTASQEEPAFISYACDIVGGSIPSAAAADWDGDGSDGLDDLYDWWYATAWNITDQLDNNAAGDVDIAALWCGGDSGGLFDDFVDFQTDLGIFSVDPAATAMTTSGLAPLVIPQTLDFDCGEGKNVDTFDIDAQAVWNAWNSFIFGFEGGCDVDFARNGVVTTQILGTGEVGVATVTAQQGGGVSPPRTINVTFVGEAGLALFITAPATVGLLGDDFTVTVTDTDGRPVGGETVECTLDPTGGALAIIPQTGTTGSLTSDNPGEVTLTLQPTGASVLGGEELTLTCVLDRDRSVSASATINLSTTPELETVDLVMGCNFVSWTGADATEPADLAAGVAPEDILAGIWAQQPAPNWAGYNPDFPEVSDMGPVDQLDVIAVCVTDEGTFSRPVI